MGVNESPIGNLVASGRAGSFDPTIALAFGRAVRAARVSLLIAQDQLALRAGVDRSFLGKLERGQRQPSLAILLRLARALNLSGADLVSRVERELLDGLGEVPATTVEPD